MTAYVIRLVQKYKDQWPLVLMLALLPGMDDHQVNAEETPISEPSLASSYDEQRSSALATRAADWRNGAIVYQVFVDRFAPPADLEFKRSLYQPPRRLRDWDQTPERGSFLPDHGVWTQELDFWGGDLHSLIGKLDYVQQLGADVLYLNPIHQALTNHKYDPQDYFAVSTEYGTREDLKALADAVHQRDMRLVLDGVFNHMGKSSPWFQEALADPDSAYRDWFFIGPQYDRGYRSWANSGNLPELRTENPAVRHCIFGGPEAVVQSYLRDGVDGWRLDVAPELGFGFLAALTRAAHEAKPGSLVIGENWLYPEEWSPALDAVMNFHAWQIIRYLVERKVSGGHAGRMLDRMIADTGLEPVLKSWIILDNHDTPRLATAMPQKWRRRMAQVLQFTLPGCPCVYYGTEVGMQGGDDPEQRAPMRWDRVTDGNPELRWMRKLIDLRRGNRALKIGDFRLLDSVKLLAFLRRTDRVSETIVVVANPTGRPISEVISLRDSKLMNWQWLNNELGDGKVRVRCGTIHVKMPPRTIWVLRPAMPTANEHNPYKRVQ